MVDRLNLRTPNGYDGQPGTVHKMGIVRLASSADVLAGTDPAKVITPETLADKMASPGPIGATTPAAGTFTNMTVNDVFAMDGGAVTDFIGTATLVTGTVVVANTAITAADRIMISRNALNASPALGFLIYTINPGVSFSVTSYTSAGVVAATDVSGFAYVITRQV